MDKRSRRRRDVESREERSVERGKVEERGLSTSKKCQATQRHPPKKKERLLPTLWLACSLSLALSPSLSHSFPFCLLAFAPTQHSRSRCPRSLSFSIAIAAAAAALFSFSTFSACAAASSSSSLCLLRCRPHSSAILCACLPAWLPLFAPAPSLGGRSWQRTFW